jgi:peptide/nickel transport system ATP-binding protein
MSFVVKKLLIKDGDKVLVDISFKIDDSFALVGQSGSGKSLTLKAILGMLPNNLDVWFDYESSFDLVRGESVAIVVQNPFTALSPLTKIKSQFFISEDEAKRYLKMVELDESLLHRYPSELSGGQLQRVVIAMALSSKPKLLMLDEPTTALDRDSRDSIIALINRLKKQMDFMVLFVTHEVLLTKELCEDIAILKNGKIIESGKSEEVLANAKEDYSKELINSNFKNRGKRV